MQSARGHCRDGESITSPPTIPVTCDAHNQTLQNLHVESCVDNLTLRREFVVHNSVAVKKNHQHDFDFWFAFPWFFQSRRIFLFPLSALWLQLDVVLVDPQFVICDDPYQEFIAFLWGYPVNATLFPSQLLLRSEQFWYNLGTNLFHFHMFRQNRVNRRLSQTKFFCYHSNSQSAVTEDERTYTINVFITTWGGGASWPCIVLGVFTAFLKMLDLLENSSFL